MGATMLDVLMENWWVMVARGAVAVLLGALALLIPGLTLGLLVALVAAYLAVDGTLTALLGAQLRGRDAHARALIAEGAAGVLIGVLAVLWPDITAFVLLLLLGVWALTTGLLELVVAHRLRRAIDGEWLLGAAGALAALFGALLLVFPEAGARAVVWWVGCFAIVFGAVHVALGLRLRGAAKSGGGMLAA
jgi:uncharacterized membrane protein HdeD (DUF308 family)